MTMLKSHHYRVGTASFSTEAIPTDDREPEDFVARHRKKIEPWLTATCQAEHLNLLLGSGFTSAVGHIAGASATGMAKIVLGSHEDKYIDAHAEATAKRMGCGEANIEDQFRSALAVLAGLEITDKANAKTLREKLNEQMKLFLDSLLATERGIAEAKGGIVLYACEPSTLSSHGNPPLALAIENRPCRLTSGFSSAARSTASHRQPC